VAAGQETCNRIGDEFFIAYDPPPDFLGDAYKVFLEMIDVLLDGCSHLMRWK
jgi:hypothetical protein